MEFAGEIIRYLGFLQGLFLTGLCFSKRRYKSNLYLSVFLFMLSLHIFLPSGGEIIFTQFPFLMIGTSFFPFIYGPLVYHYFYYSFYPFIKPRIPFPVHLIPGGIECISLALVYFLVGPDIFKEQIEDVFSGRIPIIVMIFDSLKIISGMIYCGFIIGLIKENRGALKKWIEEKQHKQWLVALIVSFLLCWFTVGGFFLLRLSGSFNNQSVIWITQIIVFTMFLYTITFFALKYPIIFEPQIVRQQIKKKLNLTTSQINLFKESLETAMEEEVYLDEELSLKSLAEDIDIHPNVLSYILNEEYGKNFKEYINSRRLDTFINKLTVMDPKRDTILSLAYETGFSSKTTFNRVFKERFGTTPTQYLKNSKKS